MSATHRLLRFGVFELNLDTEELHKFGTKLRLRPQPFRLLALLASHSGQMVTREEIKNQLWGEDTYVDFEHGMNKCIKQIRTVLGDDANKAMYIETIPRHGYRFLAPVTSKTVLAPTARVKESSSGIPADLAELIRARLAGRSKGTTAASSHHQPVSATTAADLDQNPAATAPPLFDLAVKPPTAPASSLRFVLLTSLILVVVLAMVVYWYYRR
jgi:DNA-binding winged helix-turn-helix (wHTH) protein